MDPETGVGQKAGNAVSSEHGGERVHARPEVMHVEGTILLKHRHEGRSGRSVGDDGGELGELARR